MILQKPFYADLQLKKRIIINIKNSCAAKFFCDALFSGFFDE